VTLILELSPEVEARLQQEVRRQSLDAAEYARRLIENSLLPTSPDNVDDDEAWEADMRALSEGSERLPVLPPEAFSRESN